jgi:hypothetical protein
MYASCMMPVDAVGTHVHIISTDIKDSMSSRRIDPKSTPRSKTARFNGYLHLLAILVICNSGVVSAQTSIVILMDGSHIIVAADSKQSSSSTPLCKIHQFRNLFWAISGVANSSNGFDASQLMEPSIKEGTTVAGALAYFRKTAPTILSNELAVIRKAVPEVYKTYRKEIGLEVAFFGIENGAPALAFMTYKTEDRSDGSVSVVEDENGVYPPCPKESPVACGRLLGKRDAARDYLNSRKGEWWKDLTGYAQKTVEIEIKESPDFVGPPISILRIGPGKDGTFWIDRNNCPEIQKRPQPKSTGKNSGKKQR